MGQKKVSPPRAVFDTNIVVSALVFFAGPAAWLRDCWQAKKCVPLVSRATSLELIRVLGYPKFHLSAEEQEQLLGDYLPFCDTAHIPTPAPSTPECRDPFDQIFLELALAGQADFLVSGDKDILALAGTFSIPILTLADFRARIKI